MGERIVVIGDVHGCAGELDDLLRLVAPRAGDRLFFLGDLVDRGPDSVGVIRRVRGLVEAFPGSGCIAGNHEEKNLRYRDKGREAREWWGSAASDDWAFVESLPLFHRVSERGIILVHGGLYPRFFENHSGLGEPSATWRGDRGKLAERLRRMLRVRQVSAGGDMVALGQEGAGCAHWAERYDGREGYCFFGHDPQVEPPDVLRSPHAMGLDTGCCFGGRLTAAILESEVHPSEATIVSVAAHAEYAARRHADME